MRKNTFGGLRQDFIFEKKNAFVIRPTAPHSSPTPWVWYAPCNEVTPDGDNAWLFTKLLEAGSALAGIEVGETYASPESRRIFGLFHRHLVTKEGFLEKAALLAQSRGGLNHYHFAAEHPWQIACIAGIYPVGDILSYPGLTRAAAAYGFTENEFQKNIVLHNPVERLQPIAEAAIPIFHIHGDSDKIVPLEANSLAVKNRLREWGHPMRLEIAPGKGHEKDEAFFRSRDLLDFLLRHRESTRS